MEITIKKLSPAIFVIILICFFLPFVSASCGGQKLATLSGVQLVTGTTVEGARPSEDIFRAEKATQKVDTEPLAIAALITTLVGLGYLSMDIDGFCGCCNPVNFAMLPDGRFVTCEKGLPRVKIYDADGTFSGVV
ncbi:hypothetical protein FJZ31_43220, partial [Candidatus Poribacteria bacterium]|nr:hypothetical protein [Candidatus Poribacteria bacterium]